MVLAIAMCVSGATAAANHALLIGVSNYPSLKPELQLRGPKNDVMLMRALLQTRGFRAGNIRVLADGVPGTHGDPTRARIVDEFKALAARAAPGDFVFLLMAGHGSQQPARDLGPNNPEPDGLDEIFLPRDIGRWSGATQAVDNAIVDDELRALIAAIRNRGAFVWAVFDTCHAGTMTRGIVDDEVRYRDAKPADLGIPAAAIDAAAKQGAAFAATHGAPLSNAPMTALHGARVTSNVGGLVAFFAAQSWERAPELPQPAHLPAGDANKKPHGALTYALAETIAMNAAMSYRQTAEQILHRYRAALRSAPTPLFEGDAGSLDAPLFGAKPGAPILQWPIEKLGTSLSVAAGVLHRLAPGAVFAVMANPGDGDQAALGYLQAIEVELLQSKLAPLAREARAAIAPEKLPATAYGRLVHPNTALTVRVSHPAPPTSNLESNAFATLQKLAREKIDGLAVTWLPAREAGDVRLALRDGQLWLLPASGEFSTKGEGKSLSIALAGKSEAQIRELAIDMLRSMVRAINLIKLAALAGSAPVAQSTALTLNAARGGKALTVDAGKITPLRDGDKLTLAVHNNANAPIDVNLLFIDSRYGITHLAGERFEAHGRRTLDIGTVNTHSTIGRESLLVIVSEAQPGAARADFGFLAQATLPASRGMGGASGNNDLRDLLEAAAFHPERTRDLTAPVRTLATTAIRLFTWNAVTQ